MSRTRSLVKSQTLAVDSLVEKGQIPCLLRELESYPDGPDIPDSERGLSARQAFPCSKADGGM